MRISTITHVALFSLILGAATLYAAPSEAKAHTTRHHTASSVSSKIQLKTAQQHLSSLGYYHGKIDGIMGPKTKAALIAFQRDKGLSKTGTLTTATYNALAKADNTFVDKGSKLPPLALAPTQNSVQDYYAKHPDFYGHYHQHYSDPMMLGAPAIPSRYARVDVVEAINGGTHNYDVLVNGQSVYSADNQPTVIHISKTFELQGEDAIMFTTFRANSVTCPYRHMLLTLNNTSSIVREVGNCTFDYTADVSEGSLYIKFPETDDGRVVEATWRYEPGNLQQL